MTQPPSVQPAPPAAQGAATASVTAPAGSAAPPPSPNGGPRRTAWTENVQRMRAAAMTEPGRLRIIGAVLAALLLLFGLVTAWQVSDRQTAAVAVTENSQRLSEQAALLYRSLADADTAASSGFLAAGQEPNSVRTRYDRDIGKASTLVSKAAAGAGGSAGSRRQISTLSRELPRYTGLVESARANNRRGLPLGGAYLRYANQRMQRVLLPAAKSLYSAETVRLSTDHQRAASWPWAALGTGVLAVAALGWAQRRNYRRTNRVFSPGLLGATAVGLIALGWLTGGHAFAAAGLRESDQHAERSLQALNEAWIGALQARGDENMTLVARGAGEDYETSYRKRMSHVAGTDRQVGRRADTDAAPDSGGSLGRARLLADDSAGRAPVQRAERAVGVWQQQHRRVRAQDDGGYYRKAVDGVISGKGSTQESFRRVEYELHAARRHEQKQFKQAAGDGSSARAGLAAGAGALTVLGAALAVCGTARRLSEYR